MRDLGPVGGDVRWNTSVVSEPFTTGSEKVEMALARLQDHARRNNWDIVVGLTELPIHDDDGGHLLVLTDGELKTAVLSLPALGAFGMHARARRALRSVLSSMADPATPDERRRAPPGPFGRLRVLLGMVRANRPWRLVPGLKSALVAALATGAVATVNSTVWILAASLPWWRLAVATIVAIALVAAWLVIEGELWDRPDDDSPQARQRSRLYNKSTVLTLLAGVAICYVALFAVNSAWACFIIEPDIMADHTKVPAGYGDLFILSWLVASAATVGGGLGSGLETNDAIRSATYSQREQDRRNRLEPDWGSDERNAADASG